VYHRTITEEASTVIFTAATLSAITIVPKECESLSSLAVTPIQEAHEARLQQSRAMQRTPSTRTVPYFIVCEKRCCRPSSWWSSPPLWLSLSIECMLRFVRYGRRSPVNCQSCCFAKARKTRASSGWPMSW
jgi:hypothetical protein